MRKKRCATRRTCASIALGVLATLAVSATHAQQNFVVRSPGTFDIDAQFGGGHSDNVLRSLVDPESGDYRFVGTSFDYLRDGRRVDIDLVGDVEVRNYSDPAIDNEPVGAVNALVNAELLPNRIFWIIRDNYGVGPNNPFQPTGPQNRQEINVFSTGPRVDIPVAARSSLTFEALRTESNFDETNRIDSDAEDYELTFNRNLSATTLIGIGGSERDVEFEGATDPNETRSYFLLYDRQLSSGSTQLRLGHSEVMVGTETWDSPLVDLSWVRNVGARSRLGVTATQGFSDAATAFANNNGGSGPGTGVVITVRDPYEFTGVGLNFALTYERTVLTLNLGTGRSRYTESVDFDNDDRSFDIDLQRELRARLRLGASVGVWEREFVRTAREDTELYREIFVDKSVGQRWSLRVTLQDFERDRGAAGGGAYEEDTIQVAFNVDLNR